MCHLGLRHLRILSNTLNIFISNFIFKKKNILRIFVNLKLCNKMLKRSIFNTSAFIPLNFLSDVIKPKKKEACMEKAYRSIYKGKYRDVN